MNSVINYNQVILDLVISNIQNIVVFKKLCPLIKIDFHHPPLSVSCTNLLIKPLTFSETSYGFYSGNYTDLIICLFPIDWNSLFKNFDINQAVEFFYNIIYDAIHKFISIITLHKSSFPHWLKNQIFEKKYFHKKFKISKSPIDYFNF